MFNLEGFIDTYVTKRKGSMFVNDIKENDAILHERVSGKSLLVIGGAGSIGSSFIKAILPYKPRKLVVVDINENALAELTRDLRSSSELRVPEEYLPYPMDYSSVVFEKMFRANEGFDIVANFSAHKHVRSEKDIYSVEALLQNNVLHLKYFLDLLSEFPPEAYFCVSTDKAANPVNIMGASKRIMEDLIFSYSDRFPVKTARFANVAFSNGSLPDGFLHRLQKRQPLSAPEDVKRYFVSPEESGQICMLSCILGDNREIFFPKLGENQMLSFDEIAINFLYENGYSPALCKSDLEAMEKANELGEDATEYPVYFSKSNTSGEKLFEEFYTENEQVDMDRLQALGVIVQKKCPNKESVLTLLSDLETVFLKDNLNKEDVVHIMQEYLPEFEHIETGKTLDTKM